MRKRIIFALLNAGIMSFSAVGAAPPADEITVIAQNLAEMLRDGVTVISDNQKLIDDPELGDKHLTGEVVLGQAVKSFSTTMGFDPTKIDPARGTAGFCVR